MPEDILGSPDHLNADGYGEYRDDLAKCTEAWDACSKAAGLDGEMLAVCISAREACQEKARAGAK